MKDLDNDGKDELILWLHYTGEAHTIDIYSIKDYVIKKSNKYDKSILG
ncbi:hypothetical protein GCM10008908_00400 [Clostridium subterminale]|uniref:VCBS repeat-containing protein n=1 Tax=Clostridium subterminale TaxID=1550 RepID=A0ABN1KEX3_CLOSU